MTVTAVGNLERLSCGRTWLMRSKCVVHIASTAFSSARSEENNQVARSKSPQLAHRWCDQRRSLRDGGVGGCEIY